MNRSPQTFAAVVILVLITSMAPAQQRSGPPACGPTAAVPQATTPATTTRPPSPRPSEAALQATRDAAASDPSFLTASEPVNFDIVRYRIFDYYDCVGSAGCYWDDLDAQIRRADAELDRLLALHQASTPAAARAQKLAMVLDIDETALTGYCEEKREDLGYIPAIFEKWIVTPEASIPIAGAVRLFNHARDAGVAVFFISGRPGKGRTEDQTEPTARNLTTAGYTGWQGLMLRDASYTTNGLTGYKSEARATLIAQGYRLLMNVGDQWSDLMEPPAAPGDKPRASTRAEISVKLPNPFYYLP